ncbi:hypothetical protein M0R04_10405 [Candidatus Dojkabacteria bacterium]|jgi:hypothetical protein|nr:hypothetical protein [Candidatus Dojkabacteria bacterium]
MKDRIQQVISGILISNEGRNVTPKQIQDYLVSMQPETRPFTSTPTKPAIPMRIPENQKRHFKRSGKK